ncbi:alpha/beta hydrolase-fold protein [Paenibacillus alba]|uniref:alpha/beta hydrolase-fold protein n=1 Tax=Paenibacillus alba TaxID=1197127 RepID=UPI001C2017E9
MSFEFRISRGNKRDIFVYLPPSYRYEQNKKYPVLYMHDGQNISHAAFNGCSWHVNVTVDRLNQNRSLKRLLLWAFLTWEQRGSMNLSMRWKVSSIHPIKFKLSPKALYYEAFIIEELKPYVWMLCFEP